MELLLQTALPHQTKAIENITKIFDCAHFDTNTESYKNPKLSINDIDLQEALKKVQINLQPNEKTFSSGKKLLNIDVKMETGTGRTYVYTSLIYELHAKYGLNKF